MTIRDIKGTNLKEEMEKNQKDQTHKLQKFVPTYLHVECIEVIIPIPALKQYHDLLTRDNLHANNNIYL